MRTQSSYRCARRGLLLGVFALAIAIGTWPSRASTTTTATATAAPLPRARPDTATSATAGSPPPLREPAGLPIGGPPVPTPDFADRIDELVELGERTGAAAERDDIAAAQASDAIARERFDDLLASFADAGERALRMVTELPAPAASPLDRGRGVVLELVLAAELAARHAQPVPLAGASLTQLLLDALPGNATSAEIGGRLLIDRPFLRASHEAGVLQCVRLAAAGLCDRATATGLLLTLWNNLRQSGERSSDELSQLALALLDDGDESQRAAACFHLLQDPRYRSLVLARLRERNDRAVAGELAQRSARDLPADEALQILRELGPVLPPATAAYLTLGFRAPEAVADAYRELLATDTQPAMRAELVTGIGLVRTPLGADIAQLALDADPSPDVRVQAVFALSTRDGETAERALHRALDDRRICADPLRLGALVFALQNLESGGDVNRIGRIGERLRQMPLTTESRQTLEGMLARCLPGSGKEGPPDASQPVPAPQGSGQPGSGPQGSGQSAGQ